MAPLRRSFDFMRLDPRLARGVTLLELCVALAVAAILSTMAVTSYKSYMDRSRSSLAMSDIMKIQLTVQQYQLNNKVLPDSLADVGLGNLLDPWGMPYQYLNLQGPNGDKGARRDHNLHPLNTDFDLYSDGPDKDSKLPLTAGASRDDLIRANNGHYIGLASDY